MAREATTCGTAPPSGASTCTGRRSGGERGPVAAVLREPVRGVVRCGAARHCRPCGGAGWELRREGLRPRLVAEGPLVGAEPLLCAVSGAGRLHLELQPGQRCYQGAWLSWKTHGKEQLIGSQECHEPPNASLVSSSKAHLRTSEEPDVPKALLLRDSFLLRENLWLQHSSHLTNTCLCRVVDAIGVT